MADRLSDYRRKRTFKDTPEPAPEPARQADKQAKPKTASKTKPGAPSKTKPRAAAKAKPKAAANARSRAGKRTRKPKSPRFVVHEHHATRLHWDLRLEHDGALASWAIPNGIPDDPKRNRKAIHVEDHPLSYIDFEGQIPEGNYGAGKVAIWDHGTYEAEKFRADEVILTFHGERLEGRYALFQTSGRDWMIHRMDPPVDPHREPFPAGLKPMLARVGKLPADEATWAFEIKWDGVRALAYSEPGRLRFESRNGNDITRQYPELRPLNRALSSHGAVLDGEIVAFDDSGRPSFERLQQRMHITGDSAARRRAKAVPATYVIFDLLFFDGHSLMSLPYSERRAQLEGLGLAGDAWQVPAHHPGDGAALLAATAEQGLEGIVAKRADSVYEPGRRASTWIKVKNHARQELVIGGWLPGEERQRERIGALLVGYHDNEGAKRCLRYAGRVGTGFDEAELGRLAALFADRSRPTSPFDGRQPPRGAAFVEPDLVAEIEFTEWTAERMLRHPSYKGLRDDKRARDVVLKRPENGGAAPGDRAGNATGEPEAMVVERELGNGGAEVRVGGRKLKLSNRDKVLYPATGFTKGDVIDYYRRIAPVLLPHLSGRPLTLKRYPNGVESEYFYEKQSPSHRPDWVGTAPIESRRERRTIDYTLVEDVATLVWLGNLADLELHTSLARAQAIKRPTMLVFDLDPGAPADVIDCCRVALTLRDMFDQLGLRTLVKTSGSKGLQAYVPLNSPVTYADTKPFAKAVAELLEKRDPKLIVSRMAKDLRPGKVLVDWSQNDEHKTTVNVYSLRARERPTVSTPLDWDEVERALQDRDPGALTFESAVLLERVAERGDLFALALTLEQALPAL